MKLHAERKNVLTLPLPTVGSAGIFNHRGLKKNVQHKKQLSVNPYRNAQEQQAVNLDSLVGKV